MIYWVRCKSKLSPKIVKSNALSFLSQMNLIWRYFLFSAQSRHPQTGKWQGQKKHANLSYCFMLKPSINESIINYLRK